ncbi:helix-turn-helix domain-containing protein [Aquimarina megaterium]|uniref:helix-turn-helix domain-containing protein n=1 Tax=Aquimarina megaterium TaxID=1443666 RepID=UPI000471D023|nr:AraC family transcriptional regulator [Aquimarina megaterium]
MIKLEEITTTPTFTNQLENKILYAKHHDDISISYTSTYSLKYVIEGTKHYNFGNQDIKITKNQYLIINNNSCITTEAKKGTKGLSFFLSPKLISEIYKYHTSDTSQLEFLEVTQKKSNNEVGFLLDKITNLYEHNPLDFNRQIENLFIRISETIVQEQANIDTGFATLKIVKHNTKKELFKLISVTKEYLNDNIGEDISLDSMSRDMGISKYYLHRLFTEINGTTPLGYLTAIRLAKAKHKLRYAKDSIFEIAIECGFDNTSYFSNLFKKHTGSTPTQYRKNL